jgi:menin
MNHEFYFRQFLIRSMFLLRFLIRYGRTKNDDEIYREFFEISTDFLVNIMKTSYDGFSADSILRDPFAFANLLKFFDGICMWEENSKTPIVHITWAKAWVTAMGKFDYTIRRMVQISLGGEEKENSKVLTEQRSGHVKDDHEKGKCMQMKIE